jgi:hypothetical protein
MVHLFILHTSAMDWLTGLLHKYNKTYILTHIYLGYFILLHVSLITLGESSAGRNHPSVSHPVGRQVGLGLGALLLPGCFFTFILYSKGKSVHPSIHSKAIHPSIYLFTVKVKNIATKSGCILLFSKMKLFSPFPNDF